MMSGITWELRLHELLCAAIYGSAIFKKRAVSCLEHVRQRLIRHAEAASGVSNATLCFLERLFYQLVLERSHLFTQRSAGHRLHSLNDAESISHLSKHRQRNVCRTVRIAHLLR